MRKCAWADCQEPVYNPQNRRSVWCGLHLTENILRDAYRPTAEEVAEEYVNEWAIRQEAKRLALASVNQWTWKERILSCLTLVCLSLAFSWGIMAVVIIICRLSLAFLHLIHLA